MRLNVIYFEVVLINLCCECEHGFVAVFYSLLIECILMGYKGCTCGSSGGWHSAEVKCCCCCG